MSDIWFIILVLAFGTYLIRFSFLGIIGDRELPDWVSVHLRYVAVAVLPGLIAPLVLWPEANDGAPEPARLAAAFAAFAIGMTFKSVLGSVIAGLSTLFIALAILY
ncbi:MAG: AzlD domain-containing protein [Pseudomonadota bacterium]